MIMQIIVKGNIMGKDLKGKQLGKGLSQRPDGRYMGRAQVDGQSIIIYNKKLKDLKEDLQYKISEAKRISWVLSSKTKSLTLDEWFEEWYEKYKAPTLKNGGSPTYRRKYVNYFGGRIGRKQLRDLRQLHIQTVIAELLEAGRTAKSIREAVGILRGCIEAAQANGLIMLNPVVGVIIPESEPVKQRVLSMYEQKLFVKYLEDTDSWYTEMYKIMLLTGMRIGEIGGLLWEDIDFEKEIIYVKRSLCYDYLDGVKQLYLTTPKTNHSTRSIPFFGETKPVLKHQLEKVKQKRKNMGPKWKQPKKFKGLVFVTAFGSPVGRYSAEGYLKKVSKNIQAQLNADAIYTRAEPYQLERINPHALRHTFATRCFEKNMRPRTVQEIMGHVDYNTTARYSHVLEEMKKLEAKKIGNFLEDTTNQKIEVEYENLLGII